MNPSLGSYVVLCYVIYIISYQLAIYAIIKKRKYACLYKHVTYYVFLAT